MFVLLVVLAVVFTLSVLNTLGRLARNETTVTYKPWQYSGSVILETVVVFFLVYALINWC